MALKTIYHIRSGNQEGITKSAKILAGIKCRRCPGLLRYEQYVKYGQKFRLYLDEGPRSLIFWMICFSIPPTETHSTSAS